MDANKLAVTGFGQPEPFIQIYKTVSGCHDGFLDRFLFCTLDPVVLKANVIDEWVEKLDDYNLHGFHSKYLDLN